MSDEKTQQAAPAGPPPLPMVTQAMGPELTPPVFVAPEPKVVEPEKEAEVELAPVAVAFPSPLKTYPRKLYHQTGNLAARTVGSATEERVLGSKWGDQPVKRPMPGLPDAGHSKLVVPETPTKEGKHHAKMVIPSVHRGSE